MRCCRPISLIRSLLLGLVLGSWPLAAAGDLIEPYDPGLSDIELWVSQQEGESAETTFFAGAGLGRGFSAGLSLTRTGGDGWRAGAVGLFTASSGAAEWDFFLDGGVLTPDDRRHPRETDLLAGAELSAKLGSGAIPYLRLTRVLDGGTASWRPLAGLALPFGERWRLHLEAATSTPSADGEHRLYSIGPKIFLGRMDLLFELARSREPAVPGGHWVATVGVVFYPQGN